MAAMPQLGRNRSYGSIISFVLFVGLPLLVASVYYIIFASDQYVVEFRFAVRETSTTTSTSTSAAGALASQFGISSSSSNPSENYIVADYLLSRQIIEELQSKIDVISLYSRPDVDWWARFDSSKPMEKFVKYWRDMATANFDQITGFVTADIRAFSPEDAYLVGKTMVSLSEELVNDIGRRSRMDAVRFAEEEVKRAQNRLKGIREQLSVYRNREGVIDPTTNVVASNNSLAQTLRATLMQYQNDLALLKQQNVRENAPPVQMLESRINTARNQLATIESQVGTNQADLNRPLSKVVGEYEQLDLDRQFAQASLTGALQTLDQARSTATAQHLYITPFVRPSLPRSSTYPNRMWAILTVGFVCFILWTIGLLIVRSVRDHLA
jgi:capsular polysaccharide transport system permease protein